MTDRELLELAAKAAGLEVVTPTMLKYGQWNPLTDDGDALRLAVKFGLFVDAYGQTITVGRVVDVNTLGCVTLDEQDNGDPYAATRRAITRAAAEIGKAMP